MILPCVGCESYRSPAAKVALGHRRAASAIRPNPTRTITARVSIDVDTSATFVAKRQSLAVEDDFALFKALCFAEGTAPIESQRFATGTVPYILRFLSAETLGGITQPWQGIWNSAAR